MGGNAVGVPSTSGMGDAFKNFAIGAVGGILFLLAYRVFGPLGLIAAPLLAGSMVKGTRGDVIATVAGFALIAMGGFATGGGGGEGSEEYM